MVRTRWDVAEEAKLESIGRAAGRPRSPDETVTRYSAGLAELTGDRELAEVGRRVDHVRYGPP